MIHIGICDDDLIFSDYLQTKIEQFFANTNESISISLFSSGNQLLAMDFSSLDLIFLDIQMPEQSGLELASLLRAKIDAKRQAIIFISSLDHYVFQSLRYTPLRYIRKEMLTEELSEALMAFLDFHQKTIKPFQLELTEKGTPVLVDLDHIRYVDVKGHYLIFHCFEREIHTRDKLSSYEPLLSQHSFCRIHQGCIINLAHVKIPYNNSVILTDNTQLFLSRSCIQTFHNTYMEWERSHSHVLTI